MRYLNLDLEVLTDWPSLKPTHLFLFGYIKRLCESKSGKIQARRMNGWTWVDYESLIADMPSLNLGYAGLKDSVNALVSSGLVERQTHNYQKARRSYFRVAQTYYDRETALDHADVKDSQSGESPLDEDSQGGKTTPVVGGKNRPVNGEVGGKNRQDRSSLDRELGPGEEKAPLSEQEQSKEKTAGEEEERDDSLSSLLETMTSIARESGSDISYRYARVKSMHDPGFGKDTPATVKVSFSESVGELVDEDRVSDDGIIRAWRAWTDTQPPAKWRFFVESFSRAYRQINDSAIAEHEALRKAEPRREPKPKGYWKDGKYIEGEALHIGGGGPGARVGRVAARAPAEVRV